MGNSSIGSEPSISVVVPVLNGAAWMGDLLTALLNQTGLRSQPEIIIADNGSTDGTQAIVDRFPVISLTQNKRGPSAARNCGLYQASGDIVAYLDADTLPTRTWLSELIKPFANPSIVLVGGRTADYLPTTPAERFMAQMPTSKLEYSVFRQHLNYVSSENMAVRRNNAIEIGGWDEDFLTAEDFDFCIRIVRKYAQPPTRQPGAVLFSRRRSTLDELIRQAWRHGQGLGRIHLIYPDIVRLKTGRMLETLGILGIRWAKSVSLPLAVKLKLAPSHVSEFARYHWLWSRWLWSGFFSMIRYKEWRL